MSRTLARESAAHVAESILQVARCSLEFAHTTTKINVYDTSFNVAFKTMSSFNYALMFNDIEFKVSLS